MTSGPPYSWMRTIWVVWDTKQFLSIAMDALV